MSCVVGVYDCMVYCVWLCVLMCANGDVYVSLRVPVCKCVVCVFTDVVLLWYVVVCVCCSVAVLCVVVCLCSWSVHGVFVCGCRCRGVCVCG